MPEPIQSVGTNICQIDESYELGGASPPPPLAPHAAPPEHGAEPAPNPDAVQQLVKTAAPPPAAGCVTEMADVVKAGGVTLAAAAAVVGSAPTLLGLAVTGAAYLGSSAAFGASLAKLENCEAEAAAKTKAQ